MAKVCLKKELRLLAGKGGVVIQNNSSVISGGSIICGDICGGSVYINGKRQVGADRKDLKPYTINETKEFSIDVDKDIGVYSRELPINIHHTSGNEKPYAKLQAEYDGNCEIKLIVTETKNNIDIKVEIPEDAYIMVNGDKLDFDVYLPESIKLHRLECESHNGDISIPDCLKVEKIKAHTHNGDIDVVLLPDQCDLRTHNGEVNVDLSQCTNSEVNLDVESHNDDISVILASDAEDLLRCSTHNGDAKQRHRCTTRNSTVRGYVKTHNGDITIK